MTEAENKGPARGYTWPPFEDDNEAALSHGAHSERRITPVADRLADAVREAAPYLDAPEFAAEVAAWARAEAQAQLMAEHLDREGIFDAEGKPTASLEWVIRVERQAAERRKELGLTPMSRAKLESALAAIGAQRFDLAALAAEGRKALAGRSGEGES